MIKIHPYNDFDGTDKIKAVPLNYIVTQECEHGNS